MFIILLIHSSSCPQFPMIPVFEQQAAEKMKEIFRVNSLHMSMNRRPIEVSAVMALIAAIVSVPLVFNLELSQIFADKIGASYITIPDGKIMSRSFANTGLIACVCT